MNERHIRTLVATRKKVQKKSFKLSPVSKDVFSRIYGLPESESLEQECVNGDERSTFSNDKLDKSQRMAVEECDKRRSVTLIHGPPGEEIK